MVAGEQHDVLAFPGTLAALEDNAGTSGIECDGQSGKEYQSHIFAHVELNTNPEGSASPKMRSSAP